MPDWNKIRKHKGKTLGQLLDEGVITRQEVEQFAKQTMDVIPLKEDNEGAGATMLLWVSGVFNQ